MASYEQIKEVVLDIGPLDDRLCNRPEPKTVDDLRFSFQHIMGCAILDRDVNLSHIMDEKVVDPKYKKARSKVKVIIHPDWPFTVMEVPARVVVKLKSGEEFSKERAHVIGSPEDPITLEQIKELYRKFTRGILPSEQIEWTMDAMLHMENLSDVDELLDILTFRYKCNISL